MPGRNTKIALKVKGQGHMLPKPNRLWVDPMTYSEQVTSMFFQ